jgi:hypothetical protein
MILTFALLVGAAAGDAYKPETIETRHGLVEARSDGDGTQILIRGLEIQRSDAELVELYRFKTEKGDEFLLVAYWRPGLNCHNSFAFLTVNDKSTFLTHEFGECTELQDAQIKSGRPRVVLSETVRPTKRHRYELNKTLVRDLDAHLPWNTPQHGRPLKNLSDGA